MTFKNGSQARQAKAKGRNAENAVVEYLKSWGFKHAERRRLSGEEDCGDIAGTDWCIEVKSGRTLELGKWFGETEAEFANAQKKHGAVGHALVIKRRMHQPGKWYVVMDLDQLTRIMGEYKRRMEQQ